MSKRIRSTLYAGAAVSALLTAAGCSATAPVDEAAAKTSVTLENCGTDTSFDLPIRSVIATSNSANVGTIIKVGGLDKLSAVTLNTANDAVMDSMFGPGIADIPHLEGTPTMETVLGKNADLVVGSYSGLFKGASGVTPESLKDNGVGAYVISDSCRQNAADDTVLGTMGPWDALRADIENYGKLFETEDKAKSARTELDQRLERLESAPAAAARPKVLIYDSGEEDLYTSGGNGAPNGIIDAAGATNVFADVDNTWFKASWETVAKAEPDVIVIMDYKKSADEVQGKIDAIKAREGLRDLDAVKQNRFVVLPLAMFTSGFPNIYGAEQLRAQIEAFGLAPASGIDWAAAPSA
ncbi:iron complex transport system substrate-binding protein [Rhodococcus sp. 27YEA15]|uniref:ABC transporter substrate-binding protein n=1 Tax=Rhodococcus sp. 27YEA15 TaxID=3156259 RepID=UPI003C7D7F3D